jgi:hypothetical protein
MPPASVPGEESRGVGNSKSPSTSRRMGMMLARDGTARPGGADPSQVGHRRHPPGPQTFRQVTVPPCRGGPGTATSSPRLRRVSRVGLRLFLHHGLACLEWRGRLPL